MFISETAPANIKIFLRKLFPRRLVIILLVALVIFVAFTTSIIYEHYTVNHDNLAKYLPPDTVFYAHGNLLASSQVYRSIDKFFELHPFFRVRLFQYLNSQTLDLWPRVSGLPTQEIAYALVPVAGDYQPVLLLLATDEDKYIHNLNYWQGTGWQAHGLDKVVIVSPVGYSSWRPAGKTLESFFKDNKILTVNQFYLYLNLSNYPDWINKITTNPLGLELVEQWSKTANQKLIYVIGQGNSLNLTDDLAFFASAEPDRPRSWVDSIGGRDILLMKNVAVQELGDFLTTHNALFSEMGFDANELIRLAKVKYDFDVLSDLILKTRGGWDVAIRWERIENDEIARHYLFGFEVDDSFDFTAWNDLLRLTLAYRHPARVESSLPDGSRYTEWRAELHPGLEIRKIAVLKNYEIFQAWAAAEPSVWLYAKAGNQLLVSNNERLLTGVINQTIIWPSQDSDCQRLGSSYIYVDFVSEWSEQIGLGNLLLNMKDNKFSFCIQ